MQQLKELFDSISFKKLATDLNLNPGAISYWKKGGKIPKKYKILISNYLYIQSVRMWNAAIKLR